MNALLYIYMKKFHTQIHLVIDSPCFGMDVIVLWLCLYSSLQIAITGEGSARPANVCSFWPPRLSLKVIITLQGQGGGKLAEFQDKDSSRRTNYCAGDGPSYQILHIYQLDIFQGFWLFWLGSCSL